MKEESRDRHRRVADPGERRQHLHGEQPSERADAVSAGGEIRVDVRVAAVGRGVRGHRVEALEIGIVLEAAALTAVEAVRVPPPSAGHGGDLDGARLRVHAHLNHLHR